MGIFIEDKELEEKITLLGKRQAIPVTKTAMARAILKASVSDDRGHPLDKWVDRSRKYSAA